MTITEKEWFIEAPWGRLCIVAWGHCFNPPVLLCHGLMDYTVSFRPLIKLLPENFYYIGVELPGNGKSDPFPSGLLMNFYDLVYCLEVVVKHFRWESFTFLGHSAGASIGLLYSFCFPNRVTRMILLDPTTPPVLPDMFHRWYQNNYQKLFDDFDYYNDQKKRRPVYTVQEALRRILKIDGMSKEQAEETLKRGTEDAGNGLVRFVGDQRYKIIASAPFTPDQLKGLCQKSKAEILVIVTDQSLELGKYSKMPFLLDESLYDNNFKVRQVKANHNIHINPPEGMDILVSQFLIHGPKGLDSKAKL